MLIPKMAVALLGVCCNLSLWAQPQRLPTKALYVFADNLAFVQKEGPLQFVGRKCVLDDIPNALFGSYWLNPVGDFQIAKTEFGIDTIFVEAEVYTFFDALKANVGSDAEVTYKIGNDIETVFGKIQPFSPGSDLALIKQPNGSTVFIRKDQIQQVAIQGNIKTKYWDRTLGKATRIVINKDLPQAAVQLLYFQQGIEWSPSYSFRLLKDSLSQFTMRIAVDNKAGDFVNTPVRFIVGSPKIAAASGLDPVARELMEQLPGANLNTDKMVSGTTDAAPPVETTPALNTTGVPPGSLFVYDGGVQTLKNGAKAYISVIDTTVICRQILRAELLAALVSDTNVSINKTPQYADVYRVASFVNKGKKPLLPGSIFLVDVTGEPLGQDVLTYTATGGSVAVKLDKSTSVKVSVVDEEIKRVAKAVVEGKQTWDKLEVKGVVTIENLTAKPQKVEVVREVVGEVTKTNMGALAPVNRKVGRNKAYTLTWEIVVKPNSSETISYQYDVLSLNKL